MSETAASIQKKLRPSRIILPIIIGMGIVGWLLYREWDSKAIEAITFSWYALFFLAIALLMMAIRDLGYMYRLKILTDHKLSWKKVFQIIMLWEFTSAVTPSAVGGTGVAVFFLYKEGFSAGKSTAIVMATSILDELYFIIMFPLLFLILGASDLFSIDGSRIGHISDLFSNRYFYFAAIGYLIKLLFTCFIFYGLFFNPNAVKRILAGIFRLPFIKKWRKSAIKAGDDLIVASDILKNKPFKFWFKAFTATFFSWTARYWVVNFLLLALVIGLPAFGVSFYEHIMIFGRQLVMWIMMLIMPSPGGSGFAEIIFQDYLKDFIPVGFVIIMAFLWRLISYYPYLMIGVFIIPRWVKRVFSKTE
ncbi:MAG: TIGR00374 family protein [Bacteroidetes bacterium HGW-Bacteroidetes-21]|jgi:hypothetical protein|nr:MAG: TIGR00374 family protein [Bacteroidetes bacterium HGW-Bacteroidetes-21]